MAEVALPEGAWAELVAGLKKAVGDQRRKPGRPKKEVPEGGLQQRVEQALLEKGVVPLYNTFTGQLWVAKGGAEPTYLDDLERANINLILHDAKVQAYANLIDSAITLIGVSNSFHPVVDYLKSLKWDGTPRIDTWLHDHMGADNEEYERAVGAIVLIAAVRRVRQPGCKFDECLVLVGPEGIGKSTTLRTLGAPWFSDSLPLGADTKITVERTSNVWICESAELVGNTGSKISEIKAFLSRQEDGPFRAAYGHVSMMRPRQFVPVATTNDSVFLHSTSGDRRFWPVKVYFASDQLDRDQLWAEAAAREAAGESIRLPQHLWDVAKQRQEAYRIVDPWETKIKDAKVGMEVTLPRLLEIVGIGVDKAGIREAQRIAGIMMKLGYTKARKRDDDGRTTHYELLHPFHPDAIDRNPKNAPVESELPEDYLDAVAEARERDEIERAKLEQEEAAELEAEGDYAAQEAEEDYGD